MTLHVHQPERQRLVVMVRPLSDLAIGAVNGVPIVGQRVDRPDAEDRQARATPSRGVA